MSEGHPRGGKVTLVRGFGRFNPQWSSSAAFMPMAGQKYHDKGKLFYLMSTRKGAMGRVGETMYRPVVSAQGQDTAPKGVSHGTSTPSVPVAHQIINLSMDNPLIWLEPS